MNPNYENLYRELLYKHKLLIKKNEKLNATITTLESKLDQKPILEKRLTIKGDKLIQACYNEISSIQAINGGISIKLNDKTSTFLWCSLKVYYDQLPCSFFKRISKSFIINIENIIRRIDNEIEMKNGDKIIVSKTYKNEI